MNINFDSKDKNKFVSNSRKNGYVAEQWVLKNMYCPICGNSHLKQLAVNNKASDFICPKCKDFFELKSDKNKKIPNSLMGGNYDVYKLKFRSAIKPNILYLQFDKNKVLNLFFIKKDLLSIKNISKRKTPLKRDKDYYMCTILLTDIPRNKMVPIIENSKIKSKQKVVLESNRKTKKTKDSGWIYYIIDIINDIRRKYFHLSDLEPYIKRLQKSHPKNNHIHEKIRQTLQYITKQGYIESLGAGYYKQKY